MYVVLYTNPLLQYIYYYDFYLDLRLFSLGDRLSFLTFRAF